MMNTLKLIETFVDNLPFYAYIKDTNGRFIYANKKNNDLVPVENMIGKTDFDIMPFEIAKICVAHDLEVLEKKQMITHYSVFSASDSDKMTQIETCKFPIFDEKTQEIIAICGYSKDVNNLRNENERLGFITEMLTSLDSSNTTSLALFDYDLIQDKIIWQSQFYEFYALNSKVFDHKLNSIIQMIHIQDRQNIEHNLRLALIKKDVFSISDEFRIITFTGQEKYIWCKGQIHRNAEGKAIRFLVLHLDITHTKKAEDSLKKITDRLNIATQAGQIGLWSLDISAMVFDWDIRMFNLYGLEYKPNHCIHFDEWLYLLHRDDVERVMLQFHQDFNNPNLSFFSVDFRIITQQQKLKYILAQGKIDRDNQGFPVQFTGVAVDVTVMHLNESQNRQIAFFNKIASVGHWEYDFLTDHLSFDKRMFDLYGISPNAFTYNLKAWIDIVPFEIRIQTVKHFESYFYNPNIENFSDEFEIIQGISNKRLFVQVHAEIQRNEKGQPVYMRGINLDISERKYQEKKIAENERLLKSLTSLSPVGIFRIDIHGMMKHITGAWEQLTFISIQESLDRLWYADIYEEDQFEVYKTWIECKREVKDLSVECRYREVRQCQFHKCYSCAHYVLIQIVPEYDQNQVLLGYIGTITNITERKNAEKLVLDLNQDLEKRIDSEVSRNMQQERILLQQSKLASMGEMIGNIAHQWRQPLTALSLIISNLQDAYEYNEFTPELLKETVQQSTQLILKMSNTIDDFRDFFRPNKVKVAFDLEQQIFDVINLLDASLKSYQIELTYDIQKLIPEKIKLWGYPNEFSQAILNIISNAKDVLIERKIKNPKIHIEIYSDKLNGYVIISDNGGGIAPEVLNNIFVPYFTTKDSGTGIGLYITKIIIEQNMNGSIKIYSKDNKTYVTIKSMLYKNEIKI